MGKKTGDYIEREKKTIFTSTVSEKGPVLRKGCGVVVHDIEWKRYSDFASQICLTNTGHRPEEVIKAVKFQLDHFPAGLTADWAFQSTMYDEATESNIEISRAALAEKLIKLADRIMPGRPKRVRVMFEATGSLAVNAAALIAKITALRKKGKWNTEKLGEDFLHKDVFIPSLYDPFRFSFLAFKGAFHGRHGIAKLLTDSKPVHLWGVDSSCAVGRLTFPNKSNFFDELNILQETQIIINRLANFDHKFPLAFFFEPVQGEGGINVPQAESLRFLVNHLRNRGIWIVADEIQSGLGRTGKMFACEYFDIEPDMVLLSKSLGAGFPISAVIADADKFPDLESGMHSGSFHANPLAVAAAISNLGVVERNLPNAQKMGELAMEGLERIAAKHRVITQVRGMGLMLGVEVVNKVARDKIVEIAKSNELLLATCQDKIIRFYPPITVMEGELEEGLEIFDRTLSSL